MAWCRDGLRWSEFHKSAALVVKQRRMKRLMYQKGHNTMRLSTFWLI